LTSTNSNKQWRTKKTLNATGKNVMLSETTESSSKQISAMKNKTETFDHFLISNKKWKVTSKGFLFAKSYLASMKIF
jgi:hypothetical protein